jgi:hypothetical protein
LEEIVPSCKQALWQSAVYLLNRCLCSDEPGIRLRLNGPAGKEAGIGAEI